MRIEWSFFTFWTNIIWDTTPSDNQDWRILNVKLGWLSNLNCHSRIWTQSLYRIFMDDYRCFEIGVDGHSAHSELLNNNGFSRLCANEIWAMHLFETTLANRNTKHTKKERWHQQHFIHGSGLENRNINAKNNLNNLTTNWHKPIQNPKGPWAGLFSGETPQKIRKPPHGTAGGAKTNTIPSKEYPKKLGPTPSRSD